MQKVKKVKTLTKTDDMKIIPGYWDPRELRFIEEPEVDILKLEVCAQRASGAASGGEGTVSKRVGSRASS
jgi:hypothetical protein